MWNTPHDFIGEATIGTVNYYGLTNWNVSTNNVSTVPIIMSGIVGSNEGGGGGPNIPSGSSTSVILQFFVSPNNFILTITDHAFEIKRAYKMQSGDYLDIEPKEYTFRISTEGYSPWEQRVNITKNKNFTVILRIDQPILTTSNFWEEFDKKMRQGLVFPIAGILILLGVIGRKQWWDIFIITIGAILLIYYVIL